MRTKFIIPIVFLLLYPNNLFARKPDIFPNSSTQTLLFSELDPLSCDELWRAKNEIYARNGFRFITKRGVKEFGSDGWTKLPSLSNVEKMNISRVKEYEEKRIVNNKIVAGSVNNKACRTIFTIHNSYKSYY